MTVRPPLTVMLYGRHVADVVDAGFGDTAVQYTIEAVERPAGAALSLSMPPRAEVYPTAGPGGRWVRSLLPEGRALDWVVQQYHVPLEDKYSLIALLGRDVAGAVQVVAPESTGPTAQPDYEPLSMGALADLVQRAHEMPLGIDHTGRVRLSLAGMQDKLLLHRDDRGLLRPLHGAASTVIVKPEPLGRNGGAFAGLATNEALCATLASTVGIEAAPSRVEVFGGVPALVVDRYDRIVGVDGAVHRVHQEDLLGTLGLDPLMKYEVPQSKRQATIGGWGGLEALSQPGPSLAMLAGAVERNLGRAFLARFAERVTFNVVIGNADAHARNYSLLLRVDGTVALAPMYDMVCTALYEALDPEFAQLVSGIEHIDEITFDGIVDEVRSWGVPASVAERRTRRTIETVADATDVAAATCVSRGGNERVAVEVAAVIERRARRLLR